MFPYKELIDALKGLATHIADKVIEVQEQQRQFQREERRAHHEHEKIMQEARLKTAAASAGKHVRPVVSQKQTS